MTININELFPYKFEKYFSTPLAYFSMEFAVDQCLKIYSGGLGFLAGSHMRSAYELKQNLVGVGILWKQGYYDQERNQDETMRTSFQHKSYFFLTDTGILFPIAVNGSKVMVKAFLLKPEVFQTAPIFLLTTDLPENDYLAQTICHRLYDPNETTRIAQSILLGAGGVKLLDLLGRETAVYHMNEGHALPLCFSLLNKYKSLDEVRKRVVFTTHTPEKAGNEEHSLKTLKEMSFFQGVSEELLRPFVTRDPLNYTLTALRMAKRANAVSKLHTTVAQKMWSSNENVCEIISITNAQNKKYWMDPALDSALQQEDVTLLGQRKKELKKQLFKVVADQTGKLFDENVMTIVWSRRFAGYKRANLVLKDFERFVKLIRNKKFPVQFIWAGKPYPEDYHAIQLFNEIYWKVKPFANCAVLTGYEMGLSALLKKGSDAWLNTPRIYHEASGTSGMTAAMNASVNISINDGWVPEFSNHSENSFLIETADASLPEEARDMIESRNLMNLLEREVLPTFYDEPEKWMEIVQQSMRDVSTYFDSGRMAKEYYEKLYNSHVESQVFLSGDDLLTYKFN